MLQVHATQSRRRFIQRIDERRVVALTLAVSGFIFGWLGFGPDGLLYMVTDSPQGRLLRLQPN